MTRRPLRNVSASVRTRLLNRSREKDEDFQPFKDLYAALRRPGELPTLNLQQGEVVVHVEHHGKALNCPERRHLDTCVPNVRFLHRLGESRSRRRGASQQACSEGGDASRSVG